MYFDESSLHTFTSKTNFLFLFNFSRVLDILFKATTKLSEDVNLITKVIQNIKILLTKLVLKMVVLISRDIDIGARFFFHIAGTSPKHDLANFPVPPTLTPRVHEETPSRYYQQLDYYFLFDRSKRLKVVEIPSSRCAPEYGCCGRCARECIHVRQGWRFERVSF